MAGRSMVVNELRPGHGCRLMTAGGALQDRIHAVRQPLIPFHDRSRLQCGTTRAWVRFGRNDGLVGFDSLRLLVASIDRAGEIGNRRSLFSSAGLLHPTVMLSAVRHAIFVLTDRRGRYVLNLDLIIEIRFQCSCHYRAPSSSVSPGRSGWAVACFFRFGPRFCRNHCSIERATNAIAMASHQ